MRPTNPYMVVDVETTILPDDARPMSGVGGRANPYAGAKVVYLGYCNKLGAPLVLHSDELEGKPCLVEKFLAESSQTAGTPILVGHNFNFDMHHLFGRKGWKHCMYLPDFTIWDTMTADYYLNGQALEHRMTKLDTLMHRYGLPMKDDRISEYFKAGIGADQIDPEEIIPYTANDVVGTRGVFLRQFEEAHKRGILPFIRDMMDAQLATFFMEVSGELIDTALREDMRTQYKTQLPELEARLTKALQDAMPHANPETVSPGSPVQVLTVLTGGVYKYRVREHVGQYKNGRDKFKYMHYEADALRLLPPDVEPKGTGEDELKACLRECPEGHAARAFIEKALEYRELSKLLGTYVEGYLDKVDDHNILRTSYAQAVTPTGRLSSSNVNLQNIPKEEN